MLAAFLLISSREAILYLCIAALVGLFLTMGFFAGNAHWRAFWGWLALYVAGHFCFLQMIQAGGWINLQLMHDWVDILNTHRVFFLAGIFTQFLLVAWGSRHLWWEARQTLRKLLTPGQAAALLLLAGLAAITFPPELMHTLVTGGFLRKAVSHAARIVFVFLIAGTALMNLVLAVTAIPRHALEKSAGAIRRLLLRPSFPYVAATLVVVVSSGLALVVLDAIPHVPDESAYLFQAKHLAEGKLALPAPPVPEAFNVPFSTVRNGEWFLTLAPGWSVVLALGVWIGAPWLVNPFLGGIAILLLHSFLRRTHGKDLAGGVVALLAISPWFLFMNASLMNHPLVLVLFLLILMGAVHARESRNLGWAGVIGLCTGALLLIRPLDAVLAGAVGAAFWLAAGWKRVRPAAVGVALVASLATTALFFSYNRNFSGDPLVVPMNPYFDVRYYAGGNRLGFAADIGNWGWTALDPLPGHGPIDVLVNSNQNLHLLNFELFGVAFGSLLFVGLLFVWKEWRRDFLWWFTALITIAGLNLYWFSGGPDFGARYWYVAIIPAVILTYRGAQSLAEKLRVCAVVPDAELRVWSLVGISCLLGFLILIPWRNLDKYKYYRGARADFGALIRENNFGRDLVFVRGEQVPDYTSAVAFSAPRFDRDAPGPIFVMDVGPEKNEMLVRYYSDRRVWVTDGPRKAHGRARVVAGPLPPGTVPPPEASDK